MKTIKIFASALIFFAINTNSIAIDKSEVILDAIEKNTMTSALIHKGRNKNNQENMALQFAATESDDLISKSMMPKGRNSEIIDNYEENSDFYTNIGRNKITSDEIISMN